MSEAPAMAGRPAGAQSPSAGPAVRLVGLYRSYGDVKAVDGIDVEIGDGEFFSMIGPSGCGKTTTLRMIAGLVEPSAGRIEVHGRDVTALRPHRRPVNTVFQQYALFPHLSVFENVAFGLRERRTPRAELATRVTEMLELVDLTGREKHRPSQLSGGQQQRVALARSLVLRPEVLLLDEPLGALDLKLRKQLQLQLKRIQQEVGITFVYVTHDQEEAFFMSDRVAIMRDGRIEQLGTPQQVYETPATEFVAEFVGASNRFPAPDRRRARRRGLRGRGRRHRPVSVRWRAGARGRSERGCDRPARGDLVTPGADDRSGITATVVDLAYLGHEISCLLEMPGGGQVSMSLRQQAEPIEVGRSYGVSWRVDDVWLLARDDAGAQAAV